MISPTRCLSSQLTTHLLQKFRNERGGEENWINGAGERRESSRVFYCGKVITTEIALSLLTVTALVESVAYTTLMILSCLATMSFSSHSFKSFKSLSGSSWFTVYWNFGNTLVFNLFYTNLVSHESFARFSIDHSSRGQIYKITLIALSITLLVASIITRCPININLTNLINYNVTRPEDILYIAEWATYHFPNGTIILLDRNFQFWAYQIANAGLETARQINEGAKFFKKYILEESQIDNESKNAVLECDPGVYEFVLTRCIYLYVFEPSLANQLPSFFSTQTINAIKELRRESHSQEMANYIQQNIYNHTLFGNEPTNNQAKTLFNRLKGIAYTELQGIFVKSCWQQACQSHLNQQNQPRLS